MSTLFPNNLDDATSLPVEAASTALSVNHVTAHQNVQDAIEAIEAKVGVDSSAVTTSHDYKLSAVTGSDKALKSGTSTQSVTGLTLASPKITVGSDAVGDLHYVSNVDGTQSRLAKGNDNQILKMNGTALNWEDEITTVNASTTAAGIVELATSAEITAGTATGGTGAALVVTPDALLASRPVTEVQVYSTPTTANWTKPTNAKWVEVTVIGGGGGGVSNNSGGGGGGGGGYGFQRFNASVLGSTESYTVGAGGVKDSGGGHSSFGTTVLLKAGAGSPGTSGAGGAGGTANGSIHYTGGAGGFNNATGVDTAIDPSPRGGGAPGYDGGTPANAIAGAAGGAFITNYVKAGGAGGNTSGTSGSAPSATSTGLLYGGTGGGGGGRSASGAVIGGGGAGNLGGGGGGGGVTNGGGTGGDGLVVVVTYF